MLTRLDHIACFKRPRDRRFVEALQKNYGNVLRNVQASCRTVVAV